MSEGEIELNLSPTRTDSKTIYNVNHFMDSSDEEDTGEEREPQTSQDVLVMIKKWLDLDTPELSEKMVDMLLQEGTIEQYLDQIVLIDPSIRLPHHYKPRTELPYRVRDYSNMAIVKRSYNAMELLSGNSKSLGRLLQAKFKNIVIKLFEIFSYNSNGNFHHFRKLFESLLRFKPIEILDLILFPREGQPPLVLSMLEFLDESPVSAALGTILFFPMRLTVTESERKRKLSHFLSTFQFIKQIVIRMGYSDNTALASSDFLFRIIDECTRVESSEVITSTMENPNDCLVDWVFQVLYLKGSHQGNAQKASCFKVLLALLTKSAPKEFEVPVTTGNFYTNATQKTPNGLADIHDIVRDKIVNNLTKISELLISSVNKCPGVSFGKYQVRHGFPSMRLGALEVMYEAIRELEDLTEPLQKLPPGLWRVMIDWFFDFSHNNVYHAIFYKLVVTVLKSNHIPSLKNLLTKTKFLTRMIEHYEQFPNSGCRGYILLICNVLRLTNDSQRASDYIPSMLSSHHLWNEFLPRLRADTMVQVDMCVEDDPSFQRPLPHVGPLTVTQENDDMISFLARILKAGDIDLGSQFAYSLGFVGNYPDEDDSFSELDDDETRKKMSNRKKYQKRRERRRTARLRPSNGVDSPTQEYVHTNNVHPREIETDLDADLDDSLDNDQDNSLDNSRENSQDNEYINNDNEDNNNDNEDNHGNEDKDKNKEDETNHVDSNQTEGEENTSTI